MSLTDFIYRKHNILIEKLQGQVELQNNIIGNLKKGIGLPLDFEQKGIIIGDNGHQEIATVNCVSLRAKSNRGSDRYIQYPRSIYRNGSKFILFKYSIEKDLVFYRKYNDDPWYREK